MKLEPIVVKKGYRTIHISRKSVKLENGKIRHEYKITDSLNLLKRNSVMSKEVIIEEFEQML